MFYQERQKKILEYIMQKPSVSVMELSEIFKVSTVTIRKDLNELSEQGKVERTHGGAMCLNKSSYEETEAAKELMNIESKKAIAEKAWKLIEEGSTIILDAGSTTLELALLLAQEPVKGLTIITYALNIVYALRQCREYNLVMLGGQFRHGMMSFVGPYANKMLQELHADKSFVGINGYTMEDGLTTPNPYEAEVKRNIVLRSKECILLADSQKYGSVCMSKVADVAEIDALVTDEALPEVARRELQERGVMVY